MRMDPRIDDYIARQADFARPILERIRAAFHAALPDVEEGIRWGMPSFSYGGRPLANMAAFKAHATLSFWRGGEIVEESPSERAMGQFGRMTEPDDLPVEPELLRMIRDAAALAEQGAPARPKKRPVPEPAIPDDLSAALALRPRAAETFAAFSPACRRDYLEWIVEAKRPETRARRIAEAVGWIAEGKSRNWKYERKSSR
ncbi:YdeI/OmpD-associated family protein [Allosphingosinicella deserti]|uniref:YdhG-like domain-containing protein n=1 Tax=Allosphingosinicella deserti TaxID=2116704 RepID=A0A2P7QI00_9SPHN|nr:YdeI/OmpD-associated family protein [Sphingomonas deserti]PSJ37573.1 hypothetical protein C7I55_21065 [Sphingomonas deserti]